MGWSEENPIFGMDFQKPVTFPAKLVPPLREETYQTKNDQKSPTKRTKLNPTAPD